MRRTANKKPITYTIDGLKDDLKVKHSEELFGIEQELPYQCPRVDSFLEDIDAMKVHISRLNSLIKDNENNNNQIYIVRECSIIKEYEDCLKESLEEVRKACENLRRWGENWKQLARNLFDEVPDNKRFVHEKHKDKIK